MARPQKEAYELSDAEKRDLIQLIQQGKALPERYRFLLFEDKREVELVWNGKTREVCTTILPFQSLEHIDEPRKEAPEVQGSLFDPRGRQVKGWTNKLIWGDNRLILSSLKSGALRQQIEEAGGLKLIYIDPPFDVGSDFSVDVEIGGETFHKEPNLLEQIAYRDTWGRGADSFISMIYERLILMRDLMAKEGVIYVHMGWGVSHYVRGVLDEVFGKDRAVNQIIWKRQTAHSDSGQGSQHLGRLHDVIFLYAKDEQYPWNLQYMPYDESYIKSHYGRVDEAGRSYRLDNLTAPGGAGKGNPSYEFLGVTRFWRYGREKMEELYRAGRVIQTKPGTVPQYKRFLDEMPGVPVQDIWDDISAVNSQAKEAEGYATQKPEALLERIIKANSNEGDLVADFFCGSGTTAAVAEKLGRKWITTDLGKFGIHTTRKRLIQVQRSQQEAGKPFRAFEVLNLGRYERQAYLNVGGRLTGAQKELALAQKEREFRDLILRAYKAELLEDQSFFQGKNAGRLAGR